VTSVFGSMYDHRQVKTGVVGGGGGEVRVVATLW
jgi:hypothetical protein